jgi:hypothetical protein
MVQILPTDGKLDTVYNQVTTLQKMVSSCSYGHPALHHQMATVEG